MAIKTSKTTTLFTLSPSERGDFVTKKEARTQIRKRMEAMGLKLALFSRTQEIVDGRAIDIFTAALTADESIFVSAIRGVGQPVVANTTKAKLTKLAKRVAQEESAVQAERDAKKAAKAAAKAEKAAEKAAAKATKPAAKPAAKPAPAPAVEDEALIPASLAEAALLGADQLGELIDRSPRQGGLTVKQLRAMLTSEGFEVKGLKRDDLLDLLLDGVLEGFNAAPIDEPAPSNVISLSSVMDDLNI